MVLSDNEITRLFRGAGGFGGAAKTAEGRRRLLRDGLDMRCRGYRIAQPLFDILQAGGLVLGGYAHEPVRLTKRGRAFLEYEKRALYRRVA